MARYAKGSEKEGGFYALWAKAWLDDEKLKTLPKEIKCCFSEVMACAQLIDFITGRLERGGFIMSEEAICQRAGINQTQLNTLYKAELVAKDQKGCVFIVNWHKWQNPDSKKSQNNPDKIQIKSGLNSELNPDLTPSVNTSSSIININKPSQQPGFQPVQRPEPKAKDKPRYMDLKKAEWEKEQEPPKPNESNEMDW